MTTRTNDATRLLAQDHREVEAMFEKFEALGERAKVSKKKLAEEICQALIVHTRLEEELFYPAARECGKEFEDLIDEAVVEHAS
ncbi:MAG TPA: hemerythrin domain-containing protein, partial [Telluria sp.]|nr:hemerythrin domain-containing protein [Telluria sp.]